MRAAGIICEFNPLHNGHKYLLDSIREQLAPDAVVCVMSGDFVQRGQPAIADKFSRAETAVKCGADLVLELPVYYAVNGASEFARGGVRVLKGLGCVDHLCFGSETADTGALFETARKVFELGGSESDAIRPYLSQGLSYPAAFERACLDIGIVIPTLPNDILALEYMTRSFEEGASFEYYAVKRNGADHDSAGISGGIASAKAIREILKKGNEGLEDIRELVPEETLEILKTERIPLEETGQRFFDLVRYAVISSDAGRLADVLEVSEGLENKLKEAVLKVSSAEALIALLKSKRYTYSKLSRILGQVLLGLDKAGYRAIRQDGLCYARVLAFNEKGAAVLKEAGKKGAVPIISNVNKVSEDIMSGDLLKADLRASRIYNIIAARTIYEASDQVRIPKIIV